MEFITRMDLNRHAYRRLRHYNWLWIITVVLFALLFVFTVWLSAVEVSDDGMAPMIREGDVILFDRLSKYLISPKRGDILCYRDDMTGMAYVGRVIALPGETVAIVDGDVYIDGAYLSEAVYAVGKSMDMGEYTVPKGMWFLMPDARAHTKIDAEVLSVGIARIIGCARLRVAPLNSVNLFVG